LIRGKNEEECRGEPRQEEPFEHPLDDVEGSVNPACVGTWAKSQRRERGLARDRVFRVRCVRRSAQPESDVR